jgi:hypothetical protein
MGTTENTRIVDVLVRVEFRSVVARFRFAGRSLDPAWQGAFARALDGTLKDLAGRWRFEGEGIAITHVDPEQAGVIADRVAGAVDAANAFISDAALAAVASRDALADREQTLHAEAERAQAEMLRRLGLDEANASDPDADRWDDESPASGRGRA